MSLLDRFDPQDKGFKNCLISLLSSPAKNIVEITDESVKTIEDIDTKVSKLVFQLDYIANEIGAQLDVRFYSDCPSCGKSHEIDYDLKNFDASNHYCGGSPRCCP